MSLYKRLYDSQDGVATQSAPRGPDPNDLRRRVHQVLIDELGPLLFDKGMDEDHLRRHINERLKEVLLRERTPLSQSDRAKLIEDITDDILG